MAERPNVVVIVADDLGWGDLGCYGAERIPTPHLDQLAADGARFTDCHAASAVCTPSRYALLTGRYAWRSPLKSKVLNGHSPPIIEPDRPTMASMLRTVGYATAAVGKWHLGLGWRRVDGSILNAFDGSLDPAGLWRQSDDGSNVDYDVAYTGGPTALGFDEFFGTSGSLDMPPYCFLRDDRTNMPPVRPKDEYYGRQKPGLQSMEWDDHLVDSRFAEEAAGFLSRQSLDQPFLLYLTTAAPHRPCLPPPKAAGRSTAGQRGDMVCVFDDVVGRVVGELDAAGLADNTLLLVTSDNGAVPGDEDGNTYGHHPNGPWRGQKADIWEAGHRVPLIARWPGVIERGRVCEELIGLMDLLPTVAAATGAAVPAGAAEDGVDQSDLLSGVGGSARRQLVHHSADAIFAIRDGTWKAIFGQGSGGFTAPKGRPATAQDPEGQLYWLADAAAETDNRWHEQKQRVADLYDELRNVCGANSGLALDLPLRTQLPS